MCQDEQRPSPMRLLQVFIPAPPLPSNWDAIKERVSNECAERRKRLYERQVQFELRCIEWMALEEICLGLQDNIDDVLCQARERFHEHVCKVQHFIEDVISQFLGRHFPTSVAFQKAARTWKLRLDFVNDCIITLFSASIRAFQCYGHVLSELCPGELQEELGRQRRERNFEELQHHINRLDDKLAELRGHVLLKDKIWNKMKNEWQPADWNRAESEGDGL
ncbi:hypothetical protein B0T24DRAFT_598202 [Lasiosphaeria ovina]|uniref:Uncharacterized protein n=1 Tax=Lasiosphaeria ovina TaxID=92902 RepID=A0AAE0N0E9_9PEZI|nr:hypothetical protein B0T24DRAFT_598202 [Lasiosphaeria ovina]